MTRRAFHEAAGTVHEHVPTLAAGEGGFQLTNVARGDLGVVEDEPVAPLGGQVLLQCVSFQLRLSSSSSSRCTRASRRTSSQATCELLVRFVGACLYGPRRSGIRSRRGVLRRHGCKRLRTQVHHLAIHKELLVTGQVLLQLAILGSERLVPRGPYGGFQQLQDKTRYRKVLLNTTLPMHTAAQHGEEKTQSRMVMFVLG